MGEAAVRDSAARNRSNKKTADSSYWDQDRITATPRTVTSTPGNALIAATMKRVFVLLVAIALAGCLPEKANDLAGCQTEADHFYETYQGGRS